MQSGDYTVILTYFSYFCEAQSTSLAVTVDDLPAIIIGCPALVCENEEVTYTAYAKCQSFEWSVSPEGTIVEDDDATDYVVTVLWSNGPNSEYGFIQVTGSNCEEDICEHSSGVFIPIFPDEIEISGPSLICTNGLFTAPSLPGVSYNWTAIRNSDQSVIRTGSFQNFSLSGLNFIGNVTLHLNITSDIMTCELTAQREIMVYGQGIKGDNNVCHGENVTVVLEPMQEPVTWILWFNNIIVTEITDGGSEFEIDAMYLLAPGNYYVTANLTEEIPAPCELSHLIRVDPPLPLISDIVGPSEVCPNTPYVYRSFDFSRVSWEIVGGSVVMLNLYSAEVTWDGAAGMKSLTMIKESGCGDQEKTLAISLINSADIMIGGPDAVCYDGMSSYLVSVDGASSYQWTLDTEFGSIVGNSSSPNITIQWLRPDPDGAQTTITANLSVIATLCDDLEVSTNIDIELRPFDLELLVPPVVCADTPVGALSNAVAEDTEDFTWFIDGVEVSNDALLTERILSPGVHVIRLRTTNPNGCPGIFTAIAMVEVIDNPEPQISAVVDTDCDGEEPVILSATLMASQFSGLNVTYEWFFFNTMTSDFDPLGLSGHEINTTEAGFYRVVTTVTSNGFTCTNQNEFSLNTNCDEGCMCISDAVDVTILDISPLNTTECGDFRVIGDVSDFSHPNVVSVEYRRPNPANLNQTLVFVVEDEEGLIQNFGGYTQPGTYPIDLVVFWDCDINDPDSEVCKITDREYAIVPVVADFGVSFTCNDNGASYDVMLMDQSRSIAPINNIIWTVDGTNAGGNGQLVLAGRDPGSQINVCLRSITTPDACTACQTITVPSAVMADISVETQGICANQESIFFVDTDESQIASYEWEFDDGSFSVLPNPIKSFSSSGTTHVEVTITTVHGCEIVIENDIDINVSVLSGSIASSVDDCKSMATLTVTSSEAVSEYIWTRYGEIQPQFTTAAIEVFDRSFYGVTIIGESGCMTTLDPILADVKPPFTSDISVDENICGSAELTAYGSNDFTVNWTITDASGNIQEFTGRRITIEQPGTYDVLAEATIGASMVCGELTATVSVYDVPEISMIDRELVQCEPYSQELNAVVTFGEVTWTLPNGITVRDNPIFITENGNYTAIVTSDEGCTATESIFIPNMINLDNLATGCYGGMCLSDIIASELTIPGVMGLFMEWRWTVDGVVVSEGTGEITPLVITPAMVNAEIRLLIRDDDCFVRSEPIYVDAEDCCPPDLEAKVTMQMDACVAGAGFDEYVYRVNGQYRFPDGYSYCGSVFGFTDLPEFENAFINYTLIQYYDIPGDDWINFEGFLHITDVVDFDPDQPIVGIMDVCSDADGSKCPATLEFDPKDCVEDLWCMYTHELTLDCYDGQCEKDKDIGRYYKTCTWVHFIEGDKCDIISYDVNIYNNSEPPQVIATQHVVYDGINQDVEVCLDYFIPRYFEQEECVFLESVTNCEIKCHEKYCPEIGDFEGTYKLDSGAKGNNGYSVYPNPVSDKYINVSIEEKTDKGSLLTLSSLYGLLRMSIS